MVLVRQVKLEAFEMSSDGGRQRIVERCDRHAFDEAWKMLSDAYKDAFLKQQNERIDEKKSEGIGRETEVSLCQKPTPEFMGDFDVQMRKRQKLIDPLRSMSD